MVERKKARREEEHPEISKGKNLSGTSQPSRLSITKEKKYANV